MNYKILLNLGVGLILFGCNSNIKSNNQKKTDAAVKAKVAARTGTEEVKFTDSNKNKEEIQALTRQMLKWAGTKGAIELLPALSKDSICVGFDFDKEKLNLEKLRKTEFFADEFIDNYDHIIHTLDKKIKNNEFGKWNVYELPTFNFANDASPWCSCQDNLSWDKVAVEIVKIDDDKGELKWNWGKLDPGTDQSWKDFSYPFRVVKVDGKWKISYLQGFDYNESIK
ncbi:hypothetical protein [Mucilaginibacter gotjawali]|uniref:Uncharacterized protein n=1 Tax=Mucilaginibacter gotjawali TaxID=1550579 RepID=A0A839SG74_9SPHI|nr:hypothetical protein [Mucilaginibacter gotjawali]MBB3056806.1 hypothetical protein [Mucilaginibacter gotjawali]